MKKTKRSLLLALALVMVTTMFAGCGDKSAASQPAASTKTETAAEETKQETKKEAEKPADFTLKYAIKAKDSSQEEGKKLVDLASSAGVKTEMLVIPGDGSDYDKKLTISLMAGDEMDIIYLHSGIINKYINSEIITPLEDISKENNYDMEGVFGKYLLKKDNKTYALPAFVDIWITLYNKKIFDDAKVPYPTAEGWTWSKYIETAKKLTNKEKGIYGSYMLDYASYPQMLAMQKNAPQYKADGTSALDDPLWAESMKFFYGLGNTDKIQPDMLTFKGKKLPWDGFAQGKYGMFVCGGWSTYLMSDKKAYPRDWKFGILPLPYADGGSKISLSTIGAYAVANTSKHKKEAFAAAAAMSEKQYTLGAGRVPARVNIPDAELTEYINTGLIAPFKDDGVTADDIKATWFDPNQSVVTEGIVGLGGAAVSQAYIEEGDMYAFGKKSLEDAMKAIKTKVDKGIEEEKSSK